MHACSTLCDPVDCGPPASSVHGILQARILGWVAMPLQGVFPTQGSNLSLVSPAPAGGFFTTSATWEAREPRENGGWHHQVATVRIPRTFAPDLPECVSWTARQPARSARAGPAGLLGQQVTTRGLRPPSGFSQGPSPSTPHPASTDGYQLISAVWAHWEAFEQEKDGLKLAEPAAPHTKPARPGTRVMLAQLAALSPPRSCGRAGGRAGSAPPG